MGAQGAQGAGGGGVQPAGPQAASLRDLALALGRSEAAVRKWAGRHDWPFGRQAPYPIQTVGEWASRHLDPARMRRPPPGGDVAGLPPLIKAQLKTTLERGKILELERRRLEGELHETAACRQRRIAQIQAARSRLLGLGRVLAPRVAGKDEPEIERVITAEVVGILEDFARDHDSETPPSGGAPDEGRDGKR